MIEHVNDGLYLLNPGDDAQRVARRVYGDVHKSNVLLTANPTNWDELDRVIVPNKKGRVTRLLAGESPKDTVQRMFPNQLPHLYLLQYSIWNGGNDAWLVEGDLVYVPER